MIRSTRHAVLALVVCCVVVASGWVTHPGADAVRAGTGDAITARTDGHAPVEGTAPATSARVVDAAPHVPAPWRWAGGLVAALAVVARWCGPQRTRAVQRAVGAVRRSPSQRPALGRAPPAWH